MLMILPRRTDETGEKVKSFLFSPINKYQQKNRRTIDLFFLFSNKIIYRSASSREKNMMLVKMLR